MISMYCGMARASEFNGQLLHCISAGTIQAHLAKYVPVLMQCSNCPLNSDALAMPPTYAFLLSQSLLFIKVVLLFVFSRVASKYSILRKCPKISNSPTNSVYFYIPNHSNLDLLKQWTLTAHSYYYSDRTSKSQNCKLKSWTQSEMV